METKFSQFETELGKMTSRRICRLIESGIDYKGIPLPALIWFALKQSDRSLAKIEFRVVSIIHLREHEILRTWDVKRMTSYNELQKKAVELKKKINEMGSKIDDHQKNKRNCERLEKRINDLKDKIDRLQKEKLDLRKENCTIRDMLVEEKRSNEELRAIFRELPRDTEFIRKDKKPEIEYSPLKEKTSEIVDKEYLDECKISRNSNLDQLDESSLQCPLGCNDCRCEKRIAFIGGVQSLKKRYQDLAEKNNLMDIANYSHQVDLSLSF
jgi:chromosome segregation ATPase